MRILALESSGLVASVAVVDGALDGKDAQTIAEYTVNYKRPILRRFCRCWMRW